MNVHPVDDESCLIRLMPQAGCSLKLRIVGTLEISAHLTGRPVMDLHYGCKLLEI